MGIGFDKGSQYRFNVTFLVQKDVSGSEQTSTGGAEIISAEGDTLFDAITVLSAGVPFRINFSRVNTFFFGEEVARSGRIKELSNITFNALKIRQSAKLMVCLGTAQRLMQGLCLEDVPNITKLQFSVFQDYAGEHKRTAVGSVDDAGRRRCERRKKTGVHCEGNDGRG